MDSDVWMWMNAYVTMGNDHFNDWTKKEETLKQLSDHKKKRWKRVVANHQWLSLSFTIITLYYHYYHYYHSFSTFWLNMRCMPK